MQQFLPIRNYVFRVINEEQCKINLKERDNINSVKHHLSFCLLSKANHIRFFLLFLTFYRKLVVLVSSPLNTYNVNTITPDKVSLNFLQNPKL